MARSLPTWSTDNHDAQIPARVRARVFERDGGRCQHCTRKLGPGFTKFAFDHVVALANGGAHSEANIQLLCSECHASKTGRDVAEKAKVARIKARHLGLKPSGKWPKRPMNGRTTSNTKFVDRPNQGEENEH